MSAAEKTSHTLSQSGLGQSGQNLVRIVIASYFLAVSLGLIPGTVAWPLTATFLPEPWADVAGKAVIFTTAYLVLVGAWLRVSALLLATVLFWSSYIENAGGGNLEAFWRDLALIGALILTYTQTLPRAAARRSALRWTPRARRLTPAQTIVPRRVVSVVHPTRTARRPATIPATGPAPQPVARETRMPAPVLRLAAVRAAEPVVENIFRDDPEIAMAG
jgi:uncharacterized membrane protein YphA (DoxX/SURF4 family)